MASEYLIVSAGATKKSGLLASVIDDITSSATAVPEPGILELSAAGGLFLALADGWCGVVELKHL